MVHHQLTYLFMFRMDALLTWFHRGQDVSVWLRGGRRGCQLIPHQREEQKQQPRQRWVQSTWCHLKCFVLLYLLFFWARSSHFVFFVIKCHIRSWSVFPFLFSFVLVHLLKPTVFCLLICRDLGYDSDEGGKGGRGASGGAKKALSVQDQMVCLFFIFLLSLYSLLCVWLVCFLQRVVRRHFYNTIFALFLVFISHIFTSLTTPSYINRKQIWPRWCCRTIRL